MYELVENLGGKEVVSLEEGAKGSLKSLVSTMKLRSSKGIVDPRSVVSAGIVQNVEPRLIQGNSIDLSISKVYEIVGGLTMRKDGSRILPDYQLVDPNVMISNVKGSYSTFGGYELFPDKLYQVEFEQKVQLPSYICGITLVRSSMAKSGCSGENGLFDSGYSGPVGMMIKVSHLTRLEEGVAIAQMIFVRASAKKAMYKGYYQKGVGPRDW